MQFTLTGASLSTWRLQSNLASHISVSLNHGNLAAREIRSHFKVPPTPNELRFPREVGHYERLAP
jgi:hypothetical protein